MTDRALETTTIFRELMAELTALDATFLDGPVPVADEQCSRATSGSSMRERAQRLLGVHALRAADAFQLAAALVWSRGQTTGHAFVSYDDPLREAAGREGFDVLPG